MNGDGTHFNYNVMIPARNRINLQASPGETSSFFLDIINSLVMCHNVLIRATVMKALRMLVSKMRKIGPRYAPKKTPAWVIMQLVEGRRKI